MKILRILQNLIFKYRYSKASPKERARMMKKYLYHIGDNVELYTSSFGTEPYLISIGNNVSIASNVKFINHDISCFNMARFLGIDAKYVDKVGCIVIHDNSFIGAYSTLLPGTSIGENCVIAAGSVVTGIIPNNEVWGGNPAKFIMKTETYAQKVRERALTFPWKYDKKGNLMKFNNSQLVFLRQQFLFNMEKNKRFEIEEKGKCTNADLDARDKM